MVSVLKTKESVKCVIFAGGIVHFPTVSNATEVHVWKA